MNLEEYAKAIEAVKKVAKKEGSKAVADTLQSFFDMYPDVREVAWQQYTPGFNDGAPCTFTLSGPFVLMNSTWEEMKDDEEWLEGLYDGGCLEDAGFLSDYDLSHIQTWDDAVNQHYNPKLGKALKKLEKLFCACEDVLEISFGDSAMCRATRSDDGTVVINVEDYDCGY